MPGKPKPPPTNTGPSLHVLARKAEREQFRLSVVALADEVFDRYVAGESFYTIAASLPIKIQGWKLREILLSSEETADAYAHAHIHRSHAAFEEVFDLVKEAKAEGDYKTAIDASFKIAAKLNQAYSEKSSLELTGKNGGPLQVKADLSLTAEQAYERLIKGE